jgi:plasmid stabilization system protein ParE
MKVVWSPLAVERALAAKAYIAADNPRAADKWASGLVNAVSKLKRHPKLGRVVTRRTDAGVESQTGPGLNCSADAGGEAWSERLSGHKDMIDPSVPVLEGSGNEGL